MTEIHNGRCEITISVTAFDDNPNETSIFNREMADKISKPPRKKVSFHDNVTDIDAESEEETTFENGDAEDHQLEEEEEELILENGDNENRFDERDLKEELEGILNVSEKINFFKSAFVDGTKEKNGLKSLGHQSSIPEARLAFVTGMVESSLAGNNSREDRAHVDSDVTADIETVLQEDGEDIIETGAKTDQGTGCADELDLQGIQPVSEMAATQVTFMKIFASPQKTKNGIDTVVDTSSILEHREEIRELWEKRMMADDNQSSPSSITIETKPVPEEGKEEVVMTTSGESETKPDHKLSNGFAKTIQSGNVEDPNANHIHEEEVIKKVVDDQVKSLNGVADHDNNNCADSLEEDNADDYVEEKTYTSETCFVMKSETVEEVKSEEVVQTMTVEDHASEEVSKKEIVIVEDETPTSDAVVEDNVDGITTVQETIVSTMSSVEQISSTESEVVEKIVMAESKTIEDVEDETPASKVEIHHEEQNKESIDSKCIKALEIPDCTDEDGDGFVRIEECLPIGDHSEDIHDVLSEAAEREILEDEQKTVLANGHETPSLPPTPDSALGDKVPSPDIEHFVKSGGLKRVLPPGVQKTEQPYSTCTTETKIAMEIREMREREEELRVMREQAALSPAPSPVPPPASKSPEPPSREPSLPSPVPNGCGYRVSSVFGHKGAVSPSPSLVAEEERRASGKGFAKESAVEKEIRVARDREEELRKQKGLPPREDDSYVKPSQVKSSQVRVFGKVAGANNVKQAATAKIQLEIEEQTQREMALRDTGSIQTISQERTDAKVAKLNPPEVIKPVTTNGQNGTSPHPPTNGSTYLNGRASPDAKRGSPSPNGGLLSRPASIFSQSNGGKGVSMHKFIASKGKEATFAAPQRNGNGGTPPFLKEEPKAPNMIKLKRTVSVESKIQQEIMEMKQREEELKLLHMNTGNDNSLMDEDIMEHEMNQKNNFIDYENGNGGHDEDISPRHNKLIAQWEQRIQKAES